MNVHTTLDPLTAARERFAFGVADEADADVLAASPIGLDRLRAEKIRQAIRAESIAIDAPYALDVEPEEPIRIWPIVGCALAAWAVVGLLWWTGYAVVRALGAV